MVDSTGTVISDDARHFEKQQLLDYSTQIRVTAETPQVMQHFLLVDYFGLRHRAVIESSLLEISVDFIESLLAQFADRFTVVQMSKSVTVHKQFSFAAPRDLWAR